MGNSSVPVEDSNSAFRQRYATRRQDRIVCWLLEFHEATAVSVWIYIALFLVSFLTSIGFFSKLHQGAPEASKFANVVLVILAYMMMSLQVFAYWDIHKIESHKNHRKYSKWVNRGIEIILRITILIFLLFGVGEVAHVISPVIRMIAVPSIRDWILDFLLIQETRSVAHSLFVKGSIAVFFLLLLWNLGAIICRWIDKENKNGSDWKAISREVAYSVLCLLSFLFWMGYYHQVAFLYDFSLLILVVFLLTYAFYIYLYFGTKLNSTEDIVRARVFSHSEFESWHHRIHEIYQRMRTLGKPYTLKCAGVELDVMRDVYAPNYFTDSEWFAKVVPEIVGNGSFLEIGTGTGIIAIKCAMNGAAKVVATDVNPDAIKNAKSNVEKHESNIDVREGDVYAPINDDEVFDYIFWAHPFNNWHEPVTDMLLRSGFDYQYESVRAYISGAKTHLTEKGRLLLGSGESADLRTISDIAEENGYRIVCLNEIEMPLATWGEDRIRYMLLEFLRT